MDWLLRVEGVNLDDTVFNTNNLSLIRGASLVLETFGYELKRELEEQKLTAMPVFLASSSAVFLVSDADALQAQKVVQDRLAMGQTQKARQPAMIVKQGGDRDEDLNLVMPSEHMIFVTTLVKLARPVEFGHSRTLSPADTDVVAAALALARKQAQRQQMAMPNLPRSPAGKAAVATAAARSDVQCRIDPNRQVPITPLDGDFVDMPVGRFKEWEGTDKKRGPRTISQLFSRRSAHLLTYGRMGRKQLYDFMVEKTGYADLRARGLDRDFAFAESFEDITGTIDSGLTLAPSLGGKLAVLYIDGNGFTGHAAKSPVVFPEVVRKIYNDLFFELVGRFLDGASGPDTTAWQNPDPKALVRKIMEDGSRQSVPPLRLETLFVGGDDACLIFPAWLAMDLASFAMTTLRESSARHGGAFQPSFRAGLAIADSGTPFRRIRNLAFELMNDAKNVFPDKDQPSYALSLAIVEGADLRDRGDAALKALRGAQYGVTDPGAGFRFTLDRFNEVLAGMELLKGDGGLAKSVLHKLVEAAAGAKDEEAMIKDALKLHRLRSGDPIQLGVLEKNLPFASEGSMVFPLQVAADLWDYVAPLKGETV